ncbi:MAG TPA: DASS family sodium-coupled anion symporter [Phycisphaerae bacterium]|nr:DASS family sodium-coupled anion symporter [Phycisphaerales bacterium]HRX83737.1 DASS family sodium-coupled anion symporter [Phycisphaerae bacterium]
MSEAPAPPAAPRRIIQPVGLVLGLALFACVCFLHPSATLIEVCAQKLQLPTDHVHVLDVARGAQATLALMLLMVVWWVTEAVPLPATALLPGVLLPLLHVTGVQNGKPYPFTSVASFASYAHPVIFLFLGGFLLAAGMRKSRLALRITLNALSWRWVTRGPGAMMFSVMAVTALLSMLISNTATAAMMIPIALAMLTTIGETPGSSRLGSAMMLGIAWSASIGGIGTVIGSPPNLLAKGALEQAGLASPDFLGWMKLGMPVAALGLVVAWGLLMLLYRPQRSLSPAVRELIVKQRRELGATTSAEKVVIGIVALAMLLWLTHHHWATILPASVFARVERFGIDEIALLCGLLLFIVPAHRSNWRPVLDWRDTAYVDWGVLLLFGGGLALSTAMFKTGLSDWIAGGVVSRLHGLWPLACLLAVALMVDFLTEVTSNTAVAAMIAPLAIAVAPGLGLTPQTLCIAAAMAASLAFMLPVATPPNALVYATGYFRIGQMIRAGFLMNLLGCLLLVGLLWLLM